MSFEPVMILYLVVLLLALSFHEMAHAWTANRLGDPTAAMLGRITMNPIAHIDPVGTILVPLLLAVTNAGLMIGWAKPTPVNPRNLRRPRRDDALVAAAGPLSNLMLAVAGAVIFRILASVGVENDSFLGTVAMLMVIVVRLNLLLAFFNLLPIPPLDGGAVLVNLMPPSMHEFSVALRSYGFFLLIVALYTGVAFLVLRPILNFLTPLLLGLG